MSRRVFIAERENFVEAAIAGDRLEHYYRLDKQLLTGSIVLGKVEKAVKQLGIFVDIGRQKNALLKYRDGIKVGDMLIVQIVRPEEGEKGCAVTERLTLAGRYAVLNDTGEYRYSRHLTSNLISELEKISTADKKMGVVFRSSCQSADLTQIQKEIDTLYDKYIKIQKKGANNTKVQFLHQESGMEVACRFAHSDSQIVHDFSSVQDEINALSMRKIEVDGVEIVFDKTEAMTVIDINSHKYRPRHKDIDTAHFNANLIALKEIARQIRLRNIGGIIMVDIISLQSDQLKYQLLDELRQELANDNVMVKAQLIEFLSIIAIVRKKRYAQN